MSLPASFVKGFDAHPLHTTRYLQEKILPNIHLGLQKERLAAPGR